MRQQASRIRHQAHGSGVPELNRQAAKNAKRKLATLVA
jgi:hypothetical protein